MLLDVSQPVNPRTSHFPGDHSFTCGWTCRLHEGAPVNLSWVKTSTHVGTHVDAPFHYVEGGARIGELPLDAFIGPALVVDAVGREALDADLLRGLDLAASPRVLFRTQRSSEPETFLDKFPLLTEDAIALMERAGVRLVGVDVPSMDAADSKTLPLHHRLARARILNVENLLLDHAEAGRYELMAAPVRWMDLDGAPLRAVLRR